MRLRLKRKGDVVNLPCIDSFFDRPQDVIAGISMDFRLQQREARWFIMDALVRWQRVRTRQRANIIAASVFVLYFGGIAALFLVNP